MSTATLAESLGVLYSRLHEQMSPAERQELLEAIGILKTDSARPEALRFGLYDAAKDLHDYLNENVPDIIDISTCSELAGEGVRKRLQALRDALRVPPVQMPQDVGAAWDAALEAAAKEVASHWNHCDTEVNQQAQAARSSAAILRMKRNASIPSPPLRSQEKP